jgi:hypothetical protein
MNLEQKQGWMWGREVCDGKPLRFPIYLSPPQQNAANSDTICSRGATRFPVLAWKRANR